MKQVLRSILIILTLTTSNRLCAQVQGKFGGSQNNLDVNAVLEVESTSKGVLLPRLTTAQQNAMSAPTNGMLIYNTDSACFVLRRAGVWRSLCAANGGEAWSTLGNAGTNANTHFLGTTDNIPLSIRVNNLQTLRFGTDTSFVRGNSGNVRGTNAVDLQSMRSNPTQVASGRYAVLGGGQDNTASGNYSALVGGNNNTASGLNAFIGGGSANIASGANSSISGGLSNSASGTHAVIVGGQNNATTGNASFIGGGSGNTMTGVYGVITGGLNNTTTGANSFVGNGSSNSVAGANSFVGSGSSNSLALANTFVGSGSTNTISGSGTFVGSGSTNIIGGSSTFVGSGSSNTVGGSNSFVGSGGSNTVAGSGSFVGSGSSNTVAGSNSFVGSGSAHSIAGSNSFIGSGASNSIIGSNSAIVGGSGLTLTGSNSFGFNASGTPNIPSSSTAYFGDVNLWLGNVSNSATELRFYEPNSSATFSGTNYTAFKAGPQATNITYTLPIADGTNNQVLTTNGTGTLAWSNGSAFAWDLLGNTGTTAGTNFVGTTDAQDLAFRTNNTERMRILSTGNIGIGTTTPSSTLEVAGNAKIETTSATTPLTILHYGTNNSGGITINKYHGTKAAPTNVKDNWNLGTILFSGSDASGVLRQGASITAVASQDFTGTASGTNLDFRSTPNGSTIVTQKMRLTHDGNLGINTTAPQYKLDIDAQTGSAGNPLRLLGLSAGATSDSIISSSSGVLRRLSINQVIANAWNITGNTGTTAGTNFIGTTDAQGLAFRTNNTERMRLSTTGDLGIGINVPSANLHLYGVGTSGHVPVAAVGISAGPEVAFSRGGFSKPAATIQMIDYGAYSSGLVFNVHKGTSNNGTGAFADNWPTDVIQAMTIDNQGRVGIGTAAPNQQLEITQSFRFPQTTTSTTGVIYKGANRFMHDYKPSANNGNNTFVGINAGNFTMTSATSWLASGNTGVGTNALTALTDAGYNTALGFNALTATTTGSYNTGLGVSTLATNTTGVGNTAVGNGALQLNTTANGGTAVGNGAMSKNTTGSANTAVGESALLSNTTGYFNTSVGQSALLSNVGGYQNTAVGLSAMQSNVSGIDNIAIGVSALYANTTTNGSIAIGNSALSSTTASGNIAIGQQSGTSTTTGGSNTFLGYQTGLTNTTGANNTLLGYQADVASAALTNATAIGNGATVNASNKIRLGNTAITNVETYGSFTTISDKRLKTNINDNFIGLNFIKAVRPVQYELTTQKGIVYDGFVAQEIDSILHKQGIKNFSGLSRPLNPQNSTLKTQNTEGGYYTVSYATFVVPLVNAVKELDALSEKLKVNGDKLAAENAVLKAELEKMKKDNAALKASVDKNSQDIEAIKVALNKKQN